MEHVWRLLLAISKFVRRHLANCDCMPVSYTSGHTFQSSQASNLLSFVTWSHTISRMPCHGAWTPASLSAHPSIGCSCTAPQIETPICTRCTTTHQFFWQQHTCGTVGGSSIERGVGGQPHKTPHFNSRHRYTPPGMTLPTRAFVQLNRLHNDVGRFISCLYKWGMASSAACECDAEQTTDHVVLHCPIHRPPHGLHGLTVLGNEKPNGCSTPAPISRRASSG